MMCSLRLPLLALLTAATLSGCYALDPEMKRQVEARKEQARGQPTAPPSAPAGTRAATPSALPELDGRRFEVIPGMSALPQPSSSAPELPLPAAPAADWPVRSAATDPAAAALAGQKVDAIATAYVALSLEIGTHEKGYIDAYYGPRALMDASISAPRDQKALLVATRQLMSKLEEAAPDLSDPIERQRRAFLAAQLRAAETRLMMMDGTRFSFAEEAERLFGVRPVLRPLESYDAALATVDALVPGDGPLAMRVETYLDRFTIPKDKLQGVFDTAIARCRGRTVAHVALAPDDSFDLQFVTGKSWSGYNYYQGGYHSIIQVNTDLPIRLSRALDLGCHEGYPGHHLLNMKLEEQMVKGRGWIEFSVYPLYSPQSLIAEGSANYGIDLAFPGHERTDFEKRVLYPLAGLDPATAEAQTQLLALTRELARAEYTVADAYLAGRIDRETALDQLQKYSLVARDRANQRLSFIETYRSYIINYGLGRDMVQAWVEDQGPDHWATTERLLASQTLPVDLD